LVDIGYLKQMKKENEERVVIAASVPNPFYSDMRCFSKRIQKTCRKDDSFLILLVGV